MSTGSKRKLGLTMLYRKSNSLVEDAKDAASNLQHQNQRKTFYVLTSKVTLFLGGILLD